MTSGYTEMAETIIQIDQPSFPTDEEAVSVIVSLLHVVVSHGHYKFAIQLLKKQWSILNTLLLSRHGSQLIFLSLWPWCTKNRLESAQLLITGYIKLVSLLMHEKSVKETCTKKLPSLCLSATNTGFSTRPPVDLATTLKPLALFLNLSV